MNEWDPDYSSFVSYSFPPGILPYIHPGASEDSFQDEQKRDTILLNIK